MNEGQKTDKFAAGQRVGEYTLVSFLGAGGMSQTWLASRPGLDKKVVVKVLLPELAAMPQARGYFSAEGKLGARLHHGNIVNLIDRGDLVDRGTGYIVLEYVEGVDLERLLGAYRSLPPEWAVYIGSNLCNALSYVHSARIDGQPGDVVHRDVTPDNVFLSCAAEVKLGDFGIAQIKVKLRERTHIPGQIKGKYRYLSPEMVRGEPVDRRADIFQVGLILYELVTGTAAFTGTRAGTDSIAKGDYRRIPELTRDVSPALVEAIERLMANDPADRPSTAAQAGELIEEACPTFFRARRDIGEAVMKLADLRASTTYNVPEHLRAMLAASVAGAPQPPPNQVILQAAPDDRTLIGEEHEPARSATPVLPENVPQPIPAEKTPIARKLAAPRAVLDLAPTEPLRLPVSTPDPPLKRARLRATWVTVVLVTLLGLGGAVSYLSRGRSSKGSSEIPVKSSAKVAAERPMQPPPAATTSLAAKIPAAAEETPVITRKADKEASREGGKEARRDESETVGIITVRKEAQPIHVTIDGASFVPPVHYKAEPGPHEVEIIRGVPPNEERTRSVVKVRAGHHYTVRVPPAAPSPTTAAIQESGYAQLLQEAERAYKVGKCDRAQGFAGRAVSQARDAKSELAAYRIYAGAACCLHDAVDLAEAWKHLDPPGRDFASYLCARYGTETPKQ